MNWIDSHAHLVYLQQTIDAVLERAHNQNIGKIVNVATSPEELEWGFALSQRYPWIYHAAAITPHDVETTEMDSLVFFEHHLGELVAIGETGLDYHYEHRSRTLQQACFEQYISYASQYHLPLIIHCREAFVDLFSILPRDTPGVVHCFTGTLLEAKQALDWGLFLSFSGIVTFHKSHALQEVARYVPLDRMVIETDAPYLAPQSHRGKQNEPSFLLETAQWIATCKGMSLEEVADQLRGSTCRLFPSIVR